MNPIKLRATFTSGKIYLSATQFEKLIGRRLRHGDYLALLDYSAVHILLPKNVYRDVQRCLKSSNDRQSTVIAVLPSAIAVRKIGQGSSITDKNKEAWRILKNALIIPCKVVIPGLLVVGYEKEKVKTQQPPLDSANS